MYYEITLYYEYFYIIRYPKKIFKLNKASEEKKVPAPVLLSYSHYYSIMFFYIDISKKKYFQS